jgi:dUTP pyrophosphatase
MQVNVQKVRSDAILPRYSTAGAACFDLHAYIDLAGNRTVNLMPGERFMVGTGLKFEVPAGHVMLIYSRSGLGAKHGIRLANSVGVIDSDYRGEVRLPMINDGDALFVINSGDRLAQAMIVPFPAVELQQVEELSETERGEGGFGSTGVTA